MNILSGHMDPSGKVVSLRARPPASPDSLLSMLVEGLGFRIDLLS